MIYGPPGSGKTVLGNQICFHLIRNQQAKVLYVTLLTESHGKLIRHLRTMSFFDEKYLGNQSITYLSGYKELQQNGSKGFLEMLRSSLHQIKPTFLIIDGMEGLSGLMEDDVQFQACLHELMALTNLYNCTTILAAVGRHDRKHPEHALVDGVLELSLEMIGPRSVREVMVHKFRGSDYLAGKHEMEITGNGVQIHPRTEIQFDRPKGSATEKRLHMSFGISKLDEMLSGGPLSGSTMALLGAPGTGKTYLGLSFLVEGARRGQPGVYYGFYEPPPRLIEKAENIGIPLKKYTKNGLIEIIWQPPLEHFLDSLAEQLLEKYRKDESPKEKRRLFIDGIEGFRAANPYPERMGRFLSAFLNQLRMLDVTTLMSEELGLFKPEVDMPNPELGNVVESILLLRMVELRSQLYRLISVMKMREVKYDTAIREFRITSKGVEVAGTFESAEAILTGHGRSVASGGTPSRGGESKDE